MIRTVFFLFLLLVPSVGYSQRVSDFKKSNYYDISLAVGKRQGAAAVSWSHLRGLGKKKKRFSIGYGARFTSYAGKNKDFITAPARLTSRQTGPQVLFSKTYDENLDTVRLSSSQVNLLNLVIHLRYDLFPKFALGFNIDAVGVGFGRRQNGELRSSIKPSGLDVKQSAKPTTFNLLLVSDNDIGNLNSELYGQYWITENLAVKGGLCFLFAEYTTANKLIFDNDRFRNKAGMALVGIVYNPFRNIKY
jgi:hypothetical protein